MLDVITDRPALLLGRRNDVLGWNQLRHALIAPLGELVMKDPKFAALWSKGRVGECVSGTKQFHHPVAGAFAATFNVWAQGTNPEHRIEIYGPDEVDRVIPALRSISRAGLATATSVVDHSHGLPTAPRRAWTGAWT